MRSEIEALASLPAPAEGVDEVEKLKREYRPTMDRDVLHSWAADVVALLSRLECGEREGWRPLRARTGEEGMTAAPKLTREEFIDGYVKRSRLEQYRTPDGYAINGRRRLALRCYCDGEGCAGWAMIYSDLVDDHMATNGQPNAEHHDR